MASFKARNNFGVIIIIKANVKVKGAINDYQAMSLCYPSFET